MLDTNSEADNHADFRYYRIKNNEARTNWSGLFLFLHWFWECLSFFLCLRNNKILQQGPNQRLLKHCQKKLNNIIYGKVNSKNIQFT